MKQITFLACNNGFGHIHRVKALIENLLRRHNHTVNLYADRHQVSLIFPESIQRRIRIIDTRYPRGNFLEQINLSRLDWQTLELEKGPLFSSDLVVSDGIPGILRIRNDAILISNFFWHEVLQKYSEKSPDLSEVVEVQRDILDTYNPRIFCSKIFATPGVKLANVILEFDTLNYFHHATKNHLVEKNKVLFSCGLGGEDSDLYKDCIAKSAKRLSQLEKTVFVERNYFNEFEKFEFLKPACFSHEMYQSLQVAIIRPGFGTLNCCLAEGVIPITYSSPDSFEMNHNALVIEKNNLGISEANPFEALEAAFELIKDPLELKTFQNNIQAIKKNGVEDIITKLLSMA